MDEQMIELLPCPFCESRDVRMELSPTPFSFVCDDCFCAGPQGDSEADAIRRWNHRAAHGVMAGRVAELFPAIAHGDDEHRVWLKQAIDAHFAGQPMPPPRGFGLAEAKIAELTEMLSMFVDAAKPRGQDGFHEMPRFSAREIQLARAALAPHPERHE